MHVNSVAIRLHFTLTSLFLPPFPSYSEIAQCQVPLASNKLIMHFLLDFCSEGPSLNTFTKLLIANCLFRLSHNIQTHQFLLQADLLEKIILFFTKYKENVTYKTSMVIW